MIKSILTCYMCNSPKTSVEHVPPRALFPKSEDSHGADLRKQLITVPSCDIHNSEKSQDDEYLMYALVFGIQNNPTASTQIKSKIARALSRNASVAKLMTKHHIPVQVENVTTGIREETIAIKIDMSRVKQAFDHIGRALYLHHYKSKWMGSIQSIQLFMLDIGAESSQEYNSSMASLYIDVEKLLSHEPSYGENPEVFTYKTIEIKQDTVMAMLLSFYEGSKVVLLFRN